MRIISKTHDYYDINGHTHDDPLIYLRKEETESIDWFGEYNYYRRRVCPWEIKTEVIGFCGEIYPTVLFNYNGNIKYAYSVDEYDKYVNEMVKKEKIVKKDMLLVDIFQHGFYGIKNVKNEWFNGNLDVIKSSYNKNKYPDITTFFEKYKIPIFSIKKIGRDTKYTLVKNPVLSDYQFYKVYDAFTTFQKIEHYLGNELVKPDDPYIEPVSDKIKAESHGFNSFSFRNEKTKEEKRRRRRKK